MNNLLTSAFTIASIALSLWNTPNALAYPTDPTKPGSFDASVYVTKDNKIRLAVQKTTAEPLTVSLHQVGSKTVLFSRLVGRHQAKAVYQLDVDELVDGTYELEIKSGSGIIIKQISLGFPTVVSSQRLTAIY